MSPESAEILAQVQLAQLRVDRLAAEARRTTSLDRLAAIRAEIELVRDGMLDVRERQIIAELEASRPTPRRHWWRRLTRRLPKAHRAQETDAPHPER